MNTIQPREIYPISYVISDPSDATVYYVRAVVRNARTGATIDTVSLTSLGNGIWAYSWTAPADTSGQGLYITITTRVYTDSGYTVLSDSYRQEQATYLVYDRFRFVQGLSTQIGAIASGPDIDYKRIEKILKPLLIPVQAALSAIQESITALSSKEQKETDLAPILAAVAQVEKALAPLNALKNTDLSGVDESLGGLAKMSATIAKLLEPLKDLKNADFAPVIQAVNDKKFPEFDAEKVANDLEKEMRARFDAALPEIIDAFIKDMRGGLEGMKASTMASIIAAGQQRGGSDRPAYGRNNKGNLIPRR